MRKKTVPLSFMIMGIVFCTCLITSNLLETKIIQIGKFSLTGGFIVFPISYIINDCISEIWGFKKTRLVIWLGFMMNFLVIILCNIAIALPSAAFWEGDEAFRFVFGLAPRIAVASLAAFLVGSFINAYVMSKMKLRDNGKRFSLRAVLSTLAGEGSDSLIFFPLAFGGLMPVNELFKLMILQVTAKTLYEIMVLPLTIQVVKFVKRIENTDVYDNDISYKFWDIRDL